jgi:hypothetical protein
MNIPGWDKLDEEQRALVEWQYRMCGDFRKALWSAITRADDHNLWLLQEIFPVEVSAYLKYRSQKHYWADTVKLAGGDVEAGY